MEDEFEEAVETEVEAEEAAPEETEEQQEETAEEPEQEADHQAPTIPRKAYEVEKTKRQALEARIKELEQAKTTAAPAKQPETLEELFDVDPGAALTHVDRQIAAANAAFDADEAQKWKDAKTDLVARGLLNQGRQQSVGAMNAEMYKAVPDFDTKKPELQALAVEFGLNEREAADILNPAVVGDTAVRMAKMLNKVHAIANAGKTAKTKEVKQATKVEPAGNGGFSNSNTTHKQLERAKASGNLDDWASVLG
jgi:hypothetical protein